MSAPRTPPAARGFSLVELAIVLVVVALLTGGLMVSLTTQQEIANSTDSRRQLDHVKEALLGFAASRGRLPCPADAASNGIEAPATGGACTVAAGFVPAVTLGLTPTNPDGYLVDPWGVPVRYAVTASDGNAFTTAGQIRAKFTAPGLNPDLVVCDKKPSAAPCGGAKTMANGVVAVILSTGRNAATAALGPDEGENLNADRTFVSRPPGPDATGNFDDLVTWLSPNLLYSKLIAAGQLP